jgi:hypothetical protein
VRIAVAFGRPGREAMLIDLLLNQGNALDKRRRAIEAFTHLV